VEQQVRVDRRVDVRELRDRIIRARVQRGLVAARARELIEQLRAAVGLPDAISSEGAAAVMLEELEYAQARGAKIAGEVIGFASSAVSDKHGIGQYKAAFMNVLKQAMASAGLKPDDTGHINAHGLSTRRADAEEAQAIAEVFGSRPSPVPVVAAKSYFGNLGAASGLVELIGSVLALQHDRLFRTLNYETPDPECPVKVVTCDTATPGEAFINVNSSPQGQASAVVVRRFVA